MKKREDDINALSVVIEDSVPNNDQDHCISDNKNVKSNTMFSNSENISSINYYQPNLSVEESTVNYSEKSLNGNSEFKTSFLQNTGDNASLTKVKEDAIFISDPNSPEKNH